MYFWNVIDRIIDKLFFFLQVKISYCCDTHLLKPREMWRTQGDTSVQSKRVPAVCLSTSEPCMRATPDFFTFVTVNMHQKNCVRGLFAPDTLQISLGSSLAYITSYALIHNCIGCEPCNCIVTVFYITFYTAVVA